MTHSLLSYPKLRNKYKMVELTLKDIKSLKNIKSSMETVHGRLDRLDRSIDKIQTVNC